MPHNAHTKRSLARLSREVVKEVLPDHAKNDYAPDKIYVISVHGVPVEACSSLEVARVLVSSRPNSTYKLVPYITPGKLFD